LHSHYKFLLSNYSVEQFGSLDNISSFPFENYLKDLKKMVRKPSFMLSQVVRRLSEQRIVKADESKQKLKKEHDSGPIPGAYCDCKHCTPNCHCHIFVRNVLQTQQEGHLHSHYKFLLSNYSVVYAY
jgi:hypothetical protein